MKILPLSLLLALPGFGQTVDFVKQVRPIFERRCYECHGAAKQKNDYRLDVREIALTGGEEHAPNIVPGDSARSPLFRFVCGLDEKIHMPPKTNLPQAELETLRAWIDQGAAWPANADGAKFVDRTEWWSLKPLSPHADEPRSIDAFVRARLAGLGLKQAAQAGPRTLIRRLYFDLIGLPPDPADVEAFVAESATEQDSAYESLVDRLLGSPRYGERWGRHWLDVVHYGETHGYDKDKPREHAWPYRDYVIRAFNSDKPYDRFIKEQIAGDVLFPGTPDGIAALGLISAGPWDLIGHMEVPETKTDGKIARHLDRDDMVQNTIGTFCSLTIQCAQCHNHKFDAITQEDYYSLQAVFAALDRTELKFYSDPAQMRRFGDLRNRKQEATRALAAIDEGLKRKVAPAYAELTRRIEGASARIARTAGNERPDFGCHSQISQRQDTVKWVQVDLGREYDLSKVVLKPCYDDFNAIGAGFGFPVRFKIEASSDADFKSGVTLFWKRHDQTFMNDFRNPGLAAFEVSGAEDDGIKGRYVRVTATKLAPRRGDYIFALAELEVLDAQGRNVAAGRPVSALDAIEAPPRWRKSNLTDGIWPHPASPDERSVLEREREQLLLGQCDSGTRARRERLRGEIAAVESGLAALPPPEMVYAGGVHHGTGNFRGTGDSGGTPRAIYVLRRGDVKSPGAEVKPGGIAAISSLAGLPQTFDPGAPEGMRRAALANWIADPRNPLTWRSIVNRVWQYHFGKAIAATPNDLGHMGQVPSNPELLDWLALTFRDDLHGSLKSLHKLIVMSATYRQESISVSEKAVQVDADNQFLWRQNRRKLDAECIRDSVLSVSGKLDLTMGGPSFRDFVIEKPQHSPHYEYALHDPEDPRCWRRSVYRFIVRSQQQPFMTVLDCADPSMRVDRRNESLSPLQALAMMNNGLMVTMAEHFAERAAKEAGGTEASVSRAFYLALGRPPRQDELSEMAGYVRQNGLPNLCRLLLNLNEFAFVD